MSGSLSLVATPIGNLDDLTIRAGKVLADCDLVAAEDTRRAGILMKHLGLSKPLSAYHMHNEHNKTAWLLDQVESGKKVALVCDAGTPAIADPGFFVVREAIKRGIEPIVIPGVSSLTFAAVASGLPVDAFSFVGFLPVKSGRRRKTLEKWRDVGVTTFIFESPHRIAKLLGEIAEVCGADTPVAVIREATKIFEEVIRGPAGELAAAGKTRKWLGEIVVGVDMRSAGGVSIIADEDDGDETPEISETPGSQD